MNEFKCTKPCTDLLVKFQIKSMIYETFYEYVFDKTD